LNMWGISAAGHLFRLPNFLVREGRIVLRMAHELTSRYCFNPFRAIIGNSFRPRKIYYLYEVVKRCTRCDEQADRGSLSALSGAQGMGEGSARHGRRTATALGPYNRRSL